MFILMPLEERYQASDIGLAVIMGRVHGRRTRYDSREQTNWKNAVLTWIQIQLR